MDIRWCYWRFMPCFHFVYFRRLFKQQWFIEQDQHHSCSNSATRKFQWFEHQSESAATNEPNQYCSKTRQLIFIKDIHEPCLALGETGFFVYFVSRLLCIYLTSLRRTLVRPVILFS